MAVACPICTSSDTVLVADKVRFDLSARVMRCGQCTQVFLDQGSFQFKPDFYESEYHQTYLTHVDPDTLDPQKYFEKMAIASRPWIERIRSLLSGSEQVLDVGCSTGHVLAGVRDKARAVYGHELNRKEVAFCRERLGLDVASVPLHERFTPASFDLITLVFVLEHIGEPIQFLNYLKGFLRPGGRFVIVVPNVEDPLLSLYDLPAFPGFYYCIEHLYYYSPRTLAAVLERAGLKGTIEPVQEYPLANHLSWTLRQRPSETLSARRLVPGGVLKSAAAGAQWEVMWASFDAAYRDFLKRFGFSDRVWAIVEPNT
jgi:SAM-dependent methyltransferase